MPRTLARSGLKQIKVIEQKIRSLYHSSFFLWLVSEFLHIFSFFRVCLSCQIVCFSPVSRPPTLILSLFILAATLNKFPLSVDKSVTWFLLCARVFSPAAAILESEKTLGTKLTLYIQDLKQWKADALSAVALYNFTVRIWNSWDEIH